MKSKIKNFLQAIKQRLFYLKNFKSGFSFVYLLPGSIRELFRENNYFKTLIKNVKEIKISKDSNDHTILSAGELNFEFPKKCFYEGDFFDIVYPYLNIKNKSIEKFVYDNPYHESEGCYENFGTKLNQGDYVIDAGANIGLFSIVASRKVGDKGKIYAIEPLKQISDFLEKNIQNNNCKNIKIENIILGSDNKNVEFYYNLDTNCNAASAVIKNDTDKTVVLKQMTLDSYVEENHIEKINFIKADIEGAERDLLKGAKNTIIKFKPKMALRTYHLPDDPKVLYDIIKNYVPEYNIVLDKKTIYAWI